MTIDFYLLSKLSKDYTIQSKIYFNNNNNNNLDLYNVYIKNIR